MQKLEKLEFEELRKSGSWQEQKRDTVRIIQLKNDAILMRKRSK